MNLTTRYYRHKYRVRDASRLFLTVCAAAAFMVTITLY